MPNFASKKEAREFVTKVVKNAFHIRETFGVGNPYEITDLLNCHSSTTAALKGGPVVQWLLVWMFMSLYRQGTLRSTLEAHLLRTHLTTRICCFTEDPVSEPMWGNYANQWQGFAVEFTLPPHFLKKVEYVKEKRPWPFEMADVERMFLTKHEAWSYEREWRIVLSGCNQSEVRIDPSWITGIAFGHKCALSDVREVLEMRLNGGLGHARCFPGGKIRGLRITA
jgi:hypothetical protein